MVIDKIDVGYVTLFKTKNYTPVGADRDAPTACEVTPQRVQPIAGQVEMTVVTCQMASLD
jgi:hypothetical protein